MNSGELTETSEKATEGGGGVNTKVKTRLPPDLGSRRRSPDRLPRNQSSLVVLLRFDFSQSARVNMCGGRMRLGLQLRVLRAGPNSAYIIYAYTILR
jgi:hypothetical protein